jgi:hypothetical protein
MESVMLSHKRTQGGSSTAKPVGVITSAIADNVSTDSLDSPITVNGMLDSGVHVMLIDADLIKQLSLRCFCLHKPLPISIALNNMSTSDSHLYEYVKIAPFAPYSTWLSCTVKAIVTPNLCVPLLLGLLFLIANRIVEVR